MFPILDATVLAPGVKRFEVFAPRVARSQRAGQFVIVRVHDHGERIPLTVADWDAQAGRITLVVQGIGKTTRLMNTLGCGDELQDVVGPLGQPSDVRTYGTCVVIGGGVGAAIAYPTARALRQAGNRVVAVVGARTRELLVLEHELRAASDELHVVTDDGSYGTRGLVTDALETLLAGGLAPGLVLAIGPIPMMRAVAECTRPRRLHTLVSLNSIMLDGTGMCGGCRVALDTETRFACVDGPEFDAHRVDFAVLARRNAMYREQERCALAAFEATLRAAAEPGLDDAAQPDPRGATSAPPSLPAPLR